jgi:hypothetical protein
MKKDDPAGDYAEAAALFASAIPFVGGAISNVLTGWSAERRYERIKEVCAGLARDLEAFTGRVRADYVRSEEFSDLVDQALRRVAMERSEEKRRLYRGVLLGAVTGADQSYDEQLHLLRVIESLQAAHIEVLRALLQTPSAADGTHGTFRQTLKRRLPHLTDQRIADLVTQLDDLRVTKVGNLKVITTAQGAQRMQTMVTALGRRLASYLREEGA